MDPSTLSPCQRGEVGILMYSTLRRRFKDKLGGAFRILFYFILGIFMFVGRLLWNAVRVTFWYYIIISIYNNNIIDIMPFSPNQESIGRARSFSTLPIFSIISLSISFSFFRRDWSLKTK